jgi:predicted nucleic acid-binding protein
LNFPLDTNVVSAWTRPHLDAGGVTWLAELDEDRAFISVTTLAELRHGIERMPTGVRKARLDEWLVNHTSPLTFVTRNVSDFDALGIDIFNPWNRP